jgi:hypothetical protein
MSMTDKNKAGSEKPLDKMTVKELREVAKDIPGITGVHGMKKDELLIAIKEVQGIEDKPAEKPPAKAKKKTGKASSKLADLSVQDLKTMIKDLKVKRQQALAEKDRKMARIYKRRISRIKKRTRQAA